MQDPWVVHRLWFYVHIEAHLAIYDADTLYRLLSLWPFQS